jgi:serine phosphatase RsbU (regulator of sigma subunit)
VTGELEYAGAGHPYPVLCTPGEAPRLLRGAQGPLLGFGGGRAYRSGTAHLAPGGALLLFTDGLVERRGEVLSTGLDRLLDAVGRAPAGAQEVLDAALARCLGDRAPEDDVCVLAVSRRA